MENVIEHAVLLSPDTTLEIDLPLFSHQNDDVSFTDMPKLDELQKKYIKFVLTKTDEKISGQVSVSEILCLKRTTLQTKNKKLNI